MDLKQFTFALQFSVFSANHVHAGCLMEPKYSGISVVWDYHVVLILKARLRSEYSAGGESADTQEDNTEAWIYDYDTLLLKPCHWKGTFLCRISMFLSMGYALKHDISGVDYISQTFRTDEDVPLEYRRSVLSFKSRKYLFINH